MEHQDEQLAHEEWEAQAVIAALGGLGLQESEALRTHLRTCEPCRRVHAEGRLVAAALAHTVPLVAAPAHLEADLRARLRRERPPLALPPRRSAWREPVWWVAVAALAVALVTGGQIWTLRRALAEEQAAQETLRRALAEEQAAQETLRRSLAEEQAAQKTLVRLLAAQDARPIPLEATGPLGASHAHLLWAPSLPTAALVVAGLPDPAPGRTYQLWLIQPDGSTHSGGLFGLDPDGRAVLDVTPTLSWNEYVQLGITEEPATGSPTPTTPVLLAGEF